MKPHLPPRPAPVFFLALALFAQAQTQIITGIVYSYDEAGNRIHRAPATISGRLANPGTAEKKDTLVVTNNNLKASFTPNPTTSGNFSITVSSNNSPTNDKSANSEKPQIFIYNPLGELIHQESTHYNTLANILRAVGSSSHACGQARPDSEELMDKLLSSINVFHYSKIPNL